MNYKTCTECGKELEATTEFFHKQERGKFGVGSWCKSCFKIYNENNKERTKKSKKLNYEKNKLRILDDIKKYRLTNKGKKVVIKSNKKYSKTDKRKACVQRYNRSEKGVKTNRLINKRHYERNRLSFNMSARIRQSLAGNKGGHHWEKLVDYTLSELRQHLEGLFQVGMSWDNHGVFGWHIDHKKPIVLFNITDYECDDFKECWALENLQPLWAFDNISKGAKYTEVSE